MNDLHLERIDAYLKGNMSKEAHKAFEEQMKADSELAQAVEWIRKQEDLIPLALMQQELDQIHDKITGKTQPKPWIWAVAASIVFIVGIALWWIMNSNSRMAQDLYAEFYRPDPGLPTLMGASEDQKLAEAMTYYREGNYEESSNRLKELTDQNIKSDTVLTYLGLSYLGEEKPEEAISTWLEIDEFTDIVLARKVQWYIAMAYLKENQLELAKEQLKDIARHAEHRYFEQALKVLDKLER